MGKRELFALLYLSSCCLMMVEGLFLAVPRGCLRFVIVVFPDHTHLLFLFSTFMELSASPFALVCSRVTLWCSNPISPVNSLKSVELNGGPLPDSIFFVILCVTNIFLSLSQGTLHDVDFVCSTTENVSFCQSPLDYSGHQDMVLKSQ